ncbi:MAG: tetraacyldisaccharide 4'-kinase [Epsilonproteobacteria bacterium]|nr:MAG: tetraacyldisaccharide 4'-kinase [Campylobacterota bacterium]
MGIDKLKNEIFLWVEQYLFFPNIFQKLISITLFPLTILYCLVILYKRAKTGILFVPPIPTISIGNLILGGSGKTPIVQNLSSKYNDIAIVLRGYGRLTKGLIVVSSCGNIKVCSKQSGDEAMQLAVALKAATIIVSEDRIKGIIKAHELGCKVVFLDDAFAKQNIKKFDILIRPKGEPTNLFCLPSGGYKQPKSFYSMADMVVQDGVDFQRVVSFEQNGQKLKTLPEDVVCITAISKPKRLQEFLPNNCDIKSFYDHYRFKKSDIDEIKQNYANHTIITTTKDIVKLSNMLDEEPILIKLNIKIKKSFNIKLIDDYIKEYKYA